MGRLQTAAQLATKYSEKFPDDVAIGLAHIAILADKKDDAAALTLATALKGRAGPSADIDIAYIQALARAGRLDDAATACAAAAAAFPNKADVVCEQAELATRRGNWTGAVERWKAAAALAPNSKRIKAGLEAAQLQVAELDLPEGDDTTD
jgi:tetratricopeptide (TPR) repeat protein